MDVPLVPALLLVGASGRSPSESAWCTAPARGPLDSTPFTIAIPGESSSNLASCPDAGTLLHTSPGVLTVWAIHALTADLPTNLSHAQVASAVPALTAASDFSLALVPMIGTQDSQPDHAAPGVSSLDPMPGLSVASSDPISSADPAPTVVAHMTRL
jgi:hypothetical protein